MQFRASRSPACPSGVELIPRRGALPTKRLAIGTPRGASAVAHRHKTSHLAKRLNTEHSSDVHELLAREQGRAEDPGIVAEGRAVDANQTFGVGQGLGARGG